MLTFLACAVLLSNPLLPQDQTCLIGLSPNVSVGGGVAELTENIAAERGMGLNLMPVSVKWSDLEPKPGQFNFQQLDADLQNQISLGFIPVLTVQTINTNQRTVPVDLMSEAWDSHQMLMREDAFLTALIPHLPSKVTTIILGNEVDGYLDSHQTEVAGFGKFLFTGRDVIHALRPNTAVGVVTMFSGLSQHSKLVAEVQQDMDLVAMTYYPLAPDFSVFSVSQVHDHFRSMLNLAGKRKLYLQEVGYPASPALGSSDSQQANFVDTIFNELEKDKAVIYGACYFLMVDFNDKFVDGLLAYYKLPSTRFRAMLSTLGLKNQEGTPRPSWYRFKERAQKFLHS